MSDWSDNLADLSRCAVHPDSLGEVVSILYTEYTAVVHGPLEIVEGLDGVRVGPGHRPLYRVALPEAEAEAIRAEDPITIRGLAYQIDRIDPDGAGMTWLTCMPEDPARWQAT